MRERTYNRYSIRLFRLAFATLIAGLPSCHLFVKPPAKPVVNPSASASQTAVSPSKVTRRFIPSVTHLEFQIDSSRSTGTIDLALDHDSLAPRRSVCECPLKGTITATLKTLESGARTLTLEKVELVTAGEGNLEFAWSPIIGTVKMLIPEGQLKITTESQDLVIQLGEDGEFSRPGYRFTVDGTGKVEATGLVLRKKIGNTETDLTIDETEPAILEGMLRKEENRWHLDLPATVMKDSFEIDEEGTTLNLFFTGRIASSEK